MSEAFFALKYAADIYDPEKWSYQGEKFWSYPGRYIEEEAQIPSIGIMETLACVYENPAEKLRAWCSIDERAVEWLKDLWPDDPDFAPDPGSSINVRNTDIVNELIEEFGDLHLGKIERWSCENVVDLYQARKILSSLIFSEHKSDTVRLHLGNAGGTPENVAVSMIIPYHLIIEKMATINGQPVYACVLYGTPCQTPEVGERIGVYGYPVDDILGTV